MPVVEHVEQHVGGHQRDVAVVVVLAAGHQERIEERHPVQVIGQRHPGGVRELEELAGLAFEIVTRRADHEGSRRAGDEAGLPERADGPVMGQAEDEVVQFRDRQLRKREHDSSSDGAEVPLRICNIAEKTPDEVLATNRGFYDAFEARDLDAMSEIWEHSDRVVCTHPGWALLRGWSEVAASWFALFQGPGELQFILTNERADVQGDMAWVTLDENLLGASMGGTVAALNLFVHDGTRWRMIAHHGSSIVPARSTD